MKFVNCTSDGVPDENSCVKVGKEYKVGIVVSVAKDALRKDLEDAGIIKGLSSGF
jgi:GTP-sensing pleiotropic transcriptional regulator CodY